MKPLSRRQFLRRASGGTLALPFLPSLLSREAYAQVALAPPPPRFFTLWTPHGCVRPRNWYPANDPTIEGRIPGGHVYRYGSLRTLKGAATAPMSRVFDAKWNPFLDKMNMFRGLNQVVDLGHHTASLGHLWSSFQYRESVRRLTRNNPSIDQIIAYSPRFYPAGFSGTRSIAVSQTPLDWKGEFNSVSAGHRNPNDRTAEVLHLPAIVSPYSIFNALFDRTLTVPSTPDGAAILRRRLKLIDDAMNDYRSLRSNTRISIEDKQRLESHIAHMNDIENRLRNPGAACTLTGTQPAALTWDKDKDQIVAGYQDGSFYELVVRILAQAFKCGQTRVATMHVKKAMDNDGDGSGTWHKWAHNACKTSAQDGLVGINKWLGEKVMLSLMTKLNEELEDPLSGRTYLDNSLLVWTQEHGDWEHSDVNIKVVTAGSAGGKLNTGNYLDYRNLERPRMHSYQIDGRSQTVPYYRDDSEDKTTFENVPGWEGVLYNRFLTSALQAMGLRTEDYSPYSMPGYGGYGYCAINNGDCKTAGQECIDRERREDRVTSQYQNELAQLGNPLPVFYK